MSTHRHSEAAFENVIEAHLLHNRYVPVAREVFDRERAIFPETVLALIRETQPKEWAKLESLHGEKTGEEMLGYLTKWMDTNGVLATLRHGVRGHRRALQATYFEAAHELNPELEPPIPTVQALLANSTSHHVPRIGWVHNGLSATTRAARSTRWLHRRVRLM